MKLLIIIRGLPGSGKSTLAHKLSEHVFEADQYFTSVVDGVEQYKFVPEQISLAHKHCFDRTAAAVKAGHSPIAVANTHSQYWEYANYLELAEEHGYEIQVIHVTGPWKNVHGCPEETIKKIRRRWQPSFLSQEQYDSWRLSRSNRFTNNQYNHTNAPT